MSAIVRNSGFAEVATGMVAAGMGAGLAVGTLRGAKSHHRPQIEQGRIVSRYFWVNHSACKTSGQPGQPDRLLESVIGDLLTKGSRTAPVPAGVFSFLRRRRYHAPVPSGTLASPTNTHLLGNPLTRNLFRGDCHSCMVPSVVAVLGVRWQRMPDPNRRDRQPMRRPFLALVLVLAACGGSATLPIASDTPTTVPAAAQTSPPTTVPETTTTTVPETTTTVTVAVPVDYPATRVEGIGTRVVDLEIAGGGLCTITMTVTDNIDDSFDMAIETNFIVEQVDPPALDILWALEIAAEGTWEKAVRFDPVERGAVTLEVTAEGDWVIESDCRG